MPQKGLDRDHFTWEQSTRIGMTWLVAEFLKNFGDMCYNAFGDDEVKDVEYPGWTLTWKSEPTPRIQIRSTHSKTYESVRDVLISLGYEVRDKKDHLVVIL